MSSDAKADAIPLELMDEALRLNALLDYESDPFKRIEETARALMARDQRAADIARKFTNWRPVGAGDGQTFVVLPVSGDQIATAILTQEKPHG